jgi:hypothetical protein
MIMNIRKKTHVEHIPEKVVERPFWVCSDGKEYWSESSAIKHETVLIKSSVYDETIKRGPVFKNWYGQCVWRGKPDLIDFLTNNKEKIMNYYTTLENKINETQ